MDYVVIIAGWLIVAFTSQIFRGTFPQIRISRYTGSYHWFMWLALIVGYLYLILRNIQNHLPWHRSLLNLLIIGIVVQLSWESVLLVSGIRLLGINPILFNSLVETNPGMLYLFFINQTLIKRYSPVTVEVSPSV